LLKAFTTIGVAVLAETPIAQKRVSTDLENDTGAISWIRRHAFRNIVTLTAQLSLIGVGARHAFAAA
jgi:hypothetical protein